MPSILLLFSISLLYISIIVIVILNNKKRKNNIEQIASQVRSDVEESATDDKHSTDYNLINYKLDVIMDRLEKLESRSNKTYFIILCIIIGTCIVLYYTYKWTYLIQPERIDELKHSITNSLSGLFH